MKRKKKINLGHVCTLLQRETVEDDIIVLRSSSAWLVHEIFTGKPKRHRAPYRDKTPSPKNYAKFA